MKQSSGSPDRSLLSQLKQVKEPPNLAKLLTDQSKSLFESLENKHGEFDKFRRDMLNDIEAGNGTSTTLTEMDTLIQGLSVLISTN